MGEDGAPAAKAGEGAGKNVNLASIGMLIGPLLAAMGGLALTGTIGRVQRDYPEWLSIAIGMVVFSGVLWVAASTLTAPGEGEKRRRIDFVLRGISLVLAGTGFVLALDLGVHAANNEPRPQISPIWSERELTVHVTVPNLSSTRRLGYQVDLVERGTIAETIYQSYVGPDADGNVDQTVVVPLPDRGEYREIGITAYTGETKPPCRGAEPDPDGEAGAACMVLTPP